MRIWKIENGLASGAGSEASVWRALVATTLGVLIWSLGTSAAYAAPLRFEFEGVVMSSSGIWDAQGSKVTGYYEYDSDAVDIMLDNTGHDAFTPDTPGNGDLSFILSVTVGETTRTTETNRNRDGDRHHRVQVFDRPSDDTFEFTALRRTPNDDFGQLIFRDPDEASSPEDPDGIAEGSFSLVDTPMSSPIEVALFELSHGTYQAWHDGAVCIEGYVDFEVMSVQVVPEPGTGVLLGAGMILVVAGRRTRRSAA